MDPTYSEEAEVFRARIREFLDSNLPEGWIGYGAMSTDEAHEWTADWRQKLAANGLLAPSWPTEYGGGGMSELEQVILAEEFEKAGAPTGGSNDAFSIQMVGNTILHWGTPEQKAHFLPRIISGEDVWCQGYSEPDAGSDLGGLGCKAILDGDEWVINGQKIWTSAGQWANWIFVLCRTDPDAPKHRGISFLLCPMEQDGVEVRPIKMLSGDHDFNETFFSDARTAKENVIGEVNAGWAVAMTLLGYERGEAAATQPMMFKAEWEKLAEKAKETGANTDPVLRDRLASTYIEVEIMRYLGMGTLTRFLGGAQPGPAESAFKLYWSEYHKRITELAVDVCGPAAMTTESTAKKSFHSDAPGAPNDAGSWVGAFYNARAGTIYAGTSQVQRNILGEMVLGLPKEPASPMTETAPQPMVPMRGLTEALHLGEDETPWVYAGDLGIKLLHVDLNQGLWILRNRFPPGYEVQTHYHTGPVYALTLAGAWGYAEYPEYVNRAGSYLFEPAHSVHTLTVPADNDGETDVWFAIHGANVNIDENGQVTSVTDAQSILQAWRGLCAANGVDGSNTIVVGGPG